MGPTTPEVCLNTLPKPSLKRASPDRDLKTNVPSSDIAQSDKLVVRYNELNRTLVHGLPEMARAYDVLHRHLPLLREMQALLSQRPKHPPGGSDFTMLHRVAGKTVRMTIPIGNRNQLPTWTYWLRVYATAIDYSVRQIQRLVMNEPRVKTVKQCGWSESDHNRLIVAATAGFDLVNAIEAGADTTALCREIKNIMRTIPEDLVDRQYEPEKVPSRKRRARRVTGEKQE